MKTSNKKVQISYSLTRTKTDDKANVTISHQHLEAVQEDEEEFVSDFEDDIAKEEENSTDNKEIESKGAYERFAFLQDDVLCSIQDELAISKSWILLDSQSSRCVLQPKVTEQYSRCKMYSDPVL